MLASACSSDVTSTTSAADDTTDSVAEETTEETTTDDTTTDDNTTEEATTDSETDTTTEEATAESQSFTIEVWADNWMAVYVDGTLIGEDSVPITTERSFNSETFTFDAAYPFTLAIEAKDYKETDSGLEYIGESNQQMGDGGIIAQVTDSSGNVVSVTTGDWDALVVHQAPLDKSCESSDDPDTECEFATVETPADWTSTAFDSSAWGTATEWSSEAVDPKIGYDDISWDSSAAFIWGTDLESDNTVLLRTVVG